MLLVQEYLKNHSLPDLAKEHGVYARFSTNNPKKFTLNYDMLEAKDGDKLAEECRGLVLEATCEISCKEQPGNVFCSAHPGFGPTRILAFPFRRFYNHGQGCAANIDWKTAKFFEKLDGTLCIVYYDDTLETWSVATRSVCDADIPLDSVTGKTFTDLFKQAASEMYDTTADDFFSRLNKGWTYMFELLTPENQIVVYCPNYEIWLLGVRDSNNKELEIEEFYVKANHKFFVCPNFHLTFEKLLDFVAARDPSKYEGVVVCDDKFNRIKIKNPAYVALNKVRDKVAKSPRALLELILMEKADDVKHLLPKEFQDRIETLQYKLKNWLELMDSEYERIFDLDRKTFALAIQANKLPMAPFMFVYSDRGTLKEWITSHKANDGGYPNAYLDNLIHMIETSVPLSS